MWWNEHSPWWSKEKTSIFQKELRVGPSWMSEGSGGALSAWLSDTARLTCCLAGTEGGLLFWHDVIPLSPVLLTFNFVCEVLQIKEIEQAMVDHQSCCGENSGEQEGGRSRIGPSHLKNWETSSNCVTSGGDYTGSLYLCMVLSLGTRTLSRKSERKRLPDQSSISFSCSSFSYRKPWLV